LAFFGCSKQSSNDTHCWQLVDNNGNDLQEVCGKTESELVHCSTCGVFLGETNWNLDSCQYFCIDCTEQTSCYNLGARGIGKLNDKYVHCWLRNAVKVNCDDSCAFWYTRYKYVYKPTNVIHYGSASYNQYCDSAYKRLSSPDSIVIKNTTDSLVLLQRATAANPYTFY